jgi:hypothetical protein
MLPVPLTCWPRPGWWPDPQAAFFVGGPAHNVGMRIRIEGVEFPGSTCGPSPQRPEGHSNIHVGVQRVQRSGKPVELLGVVPGDSPGATWTLDATVTPAPDGGVDLKGPYIQGPRGGRFIYLDWGTVDAPGTFNMFRRAKLRLDRVPVDVLRSAEEQGFLVARVILTDSGGSPICASVGAPFIEWSAAAN